MPETGRWGVTVLLLDSASLYYRAYFALPETMTAPDGTPVNAIRGFLDTVAAMVTSRRSSRVVACWDEDWRPQWRVDLVPEYKSHRVIDDASGGLTEETPDTLAPQVGELARLLPLLGIPLCGAPEAEADDVIATVARQGPCDIASGDRDLLQLVSADATLLYTGGTSASRGGKPWQIFTPDEVQQRYGVPPHVYADVAILRGDPSDGLPGVRGIGEKTATALVQTFGDIRQIQAAAQDPHTGKPMTASVRSKIIAAQSTLDALDAVVRLRPLPHITLPAAAMTTAEGIARAHDLGVGRSADRLVAALADD